MCNAQALEKLKLHSNDIQSPPREVVMQGTSVMLAYLKALCDGSKAEKLDLSTFGLLELPPEVCVMSALVSLTLNHNQLRTINRDISKLTNLRELRVSDNSLIALPSELESGWKYYEDGGMHDDSNLRCTDVRRVRDTI